MTPAEHFIEHGAACDCGASVERLYDTPEARKAALDAVDRIIADARHG